MNNIFLFTGYDRPDLIEFFLNNKFKISALVSPSAPKYLTKMTNIYSLAIKNCIPVINIKSLIQSQFKDKISDAMLYSSGYPYLINEDVFSQFKYAINCHPSLLPQNRGKYLEYIFLNKEKINGTSIHHINKGCDNGPIILQKSYKIELSDNVKTLKSKSKKIELDLLQKIIDDNLFDKKGIPQREEEATCYLKKRTPEDSELSSSTSLLDAFLMARAFNPDLYPGFFKFNGRKIIFRMEITDE